VRLHRLAFNRHAVPIQKRAMIQITARADTGTNKPARMAALGIHHASKLVSTLPSQSREVWIGVLVIACYAQQGAAPGSPARTA
jgi:hypothetical protein